MYYAMSRLDRPVFRVSEEINGFFLLCSTLLTMEYS